MRPAALRALPPTVLVLGTASLLTDVSSEMIYPLLPVFLATTLGAAPWALGLVEGAAEATSAGLKLASGLWTDRTGRRKPLILAGYGLSSLARPLVGLATVWPLVLAIRVTDRIGKGLRTSPRDALIADATPPGQLGAAYGLHRAMDHAGAVIGPLVAMALLTWGGLDLRTVFLAAAVPGALAVLVLWRGIREPPPRPRPPSPPLTRAGWHALSPDFRRLLLAMAVFTLGNSTDAFLLLRLREAGVAPGYLAALWSAHHVVKVAATWAGGRLSDRTSRRAPVLAGWAVYALVYLGLAVATPTWAVVALFLGYGLCFGLTEPAEKAWVAELVPPERRGVAFGAWQAVIGLGALPASLLFGLVWTQVGMPAAFTLGAGLAAVAAGLLLRVAETRQS